MKSALFFIVGFGCSLVSAYVAAPHGQNSKYTRAGNEVRAAAPAAAGCATGVHMIICRASTEAAGPGTIVSNFMKKLTTSEAVFLAAAESPRMNE